MLFQKRLEGFNEFYEKKRIDNIMVDADQSTKLTKLMDAFVIILEGGNEFDLTILDGTKFILSLITKS